MFKLLFYLNILFIYISLNESKTFKRSLLSDNSVPDGRPWQKLWFPHPPNYKNDVKPESLPLTSSSKTNDDLSHRNDSRDSTVLWLPHPPSYNSDLTDKTKSTDWPGLWFPYSPKYHGDRAKENVKLGENKIYQQCDNGKYNINVDFDPHDKRDSFNYLCLDKRAKYTPNLNTSALLKEYVIPPAYKPPVKCVNESIEYTELIPTFGPYRPLPPNFGSYKYLPPQRWLHSLADGAIVLLYHPCAFAGQVKQLQNTLRGCLYRHIITPSQLLTPQYPLALLAWGKSLHMSVVDDAIAVKFIKENAKIGFRRRQQKLKTSQFYEAGLLYEAHLVTDEQDTDICGYKEKS